MILFPSLLFVEHKVVREKWDRRFGLHLEIQLSKEKTLFFFSFIALFLTVYLSQFSLTLSIFLFSFACSHSRSSSRLHLVLTTLWNFTSFFLFCPNGRMASTFISSSFPSFLPFTLFTSSHNKYKPTYLDFASTNFFSSALPLPNDLAFHFFLFFLPSACPTCLSQPTHADFVHNKEKLRNMKDVYYVGWTHGAVHPTKG